MTNKENKKALLVLETLKKKNPAMAEFFDDLIKAIKDKNFKEVKKVINRAKRGYYGKNTQAGYKMMKNTILGAVYVARPMRGVTALLRWLDKRIRKGDR